MITFKPLSSQTWADLEELFGPRGACAGCWCTFWKLPHSSFKASAGEDARLLQKGWVENGLTPGIIAYEDELPVGWMALEPRMNYPRLAASKVLKPVDDQPVWSITCFFTRKSHRRSGLTIELLKAGIAFVEKMAGKIVEGYPVETKSTRSPDVFVFTGLPGAFRKAGFLEVARYSPTRPIFRFTINK